LYESARDPLAWLILAPGAGAGHDSAFIVAFANALASRGLHVVTFNFPYLERGRRVPDGNQTLERCWDGVLRAVRERAGAASPLFAGGKSMGGRIASQVAARQDLPVIPKGLVFLGYPLHPPGRPNERRTAHWPRVCLPALFIQGSRDAFGAPEELRAALTGFGGDARVMIVDGGDHSFKVPRSVGRPQDAVHADIQDAIVAWIRDTR
jgi:predicted alpha/beta-hydrolase family hydrolase